MDDSVNIYDKVIDADVSTEAKWNDEAKSNDETDFNEKKATCKMPNFYVLLTFLSIIIVY